MTVATLEFGTASAAGLAADAFNDTAVDVGLATAGGYPMLVLGPAPSVSEAPDALRLEIVDSSGTQVVNDLATRRNLSFVVEHNGSGSISFETDLDAFADGLDDAALDPSNLVRVHFGDLPDWPFGVAEGYLASAQPTKDDSGRWTLQVACPGSWDVLDFGLLWPPAGATGDTRDFNYNAGLTRDVTRWLTPVGLGNRHSFRWTKHRWPKGWLDAGSQWIWSSSPEKASPVGKRKLVGQFSLTNPHWMRFQAAGDDTLRLYFNGALVKSKPNGAWHTATTWRRHLPAGTYVVTAVVNNLGGSLRNTAGFLFSAARLNDDGDFVEWKLRSSTTSFKYLSEASVALPPDGWFPAAVMWQHVGEAVARGVEFHPEIDLTFSDTKDSAGSAWTAKGPVEYDIGISGAALGDKIRSLGIDMAMLPGLRLSAWRSRGFDLRDRVVLSRPGGVGWPARTWSRVRTTALTHQESGWTETAGDASLSTEFGRRELAVSGGGTDGDTQAGSLARSAMSTSASPEETIEITVSSAAMVGEDAQPVPFRDFNVADVVLMETVGGFTPVKVMSIRGDEQADKSIMFTIAGYPA